MMAEPENRYRAGRATLRRPARRATGTTRKTHVPRNCEGVRCIPPVAEPAIEPTPIWLAALIATRCRAVANGEDHAVVWSQISGRAVYTNSGPDMEMIEPLGVSLQQGHTVTVFWVPGETAYTVEVYLQYELCA
jgi:hypothetical protein